jgi:hypothetical protein
MTGDFVTPFGVFQSYIGSISGRLRILVFTPNSGTDSWRWLNETEFWKEAYLKYPEHATFIMAKILGNDTEED